MTSINIKILFRISGWLEGLVDEFHKPESCPQENASFDHSGTSTELKRSTR